MLLFFVLYFVSCIVQWKLSSLNFVSQSKCSYLVMFPVAMREHANERT